MTLVNRNPRMIGEQKELFSFCLFFYFMNNAFLY
ncbi:hypothetical protein OIA_05144, partial [Enterococcus faecium EnGen0018]